jgi:hypothetical protein
MVEIKVYDECTDEQYIEDNYECLYATLKGIGGIAVERHDYIVYDESTIKEEFLKHAMLEVKDRLNIFDYNVAEKVFKYFYYTSPVIVGNDYVYRERKDNLNELRKLAGIKITRPRKRKVSRV